jgi:hypothetical protein
VSIIGICMSDCCQPFEVSAAQALPPCFTDMVRYIYATHMLYMCICQIFEVQSKYTGTPRYPTPSPVPYPATSPDLEDAGELHQDTSVTRLAVLSVTHLWFNASPLIWPHYAMLCSSPLPVAAEPRNAALRWQMQELSHGPCRI